MQLWWADLLLTNTAAPAASGFSGSLLSPDAHGTADIAFTATDPNGPGVYNVTVQIDGNPVYNATPNTNQGKCASVGTDSTSGALMFDWQQPCLQTETVDIPVDTTALTDGQHELKVIVTDAAQNSSTVLDQTITTLNRTTVSAAAALTARRPRASPCTRSRSTRQPNGSHAASGDSTATRPSSSPARSRTRQASPLPAYRSRSGLSRQTADTSASSRTRRPTAPAPGR